MYKQYVWRHGHALASNTGKVRKSRYILYEKLKGVAGLCHWCDISLTWKTLCADHLDSNIMNDEPDNLVGSCRGCNANRSDGTGFGRRKPVECLSCAVEFTPLYHKDQRYCSLTCASKSRPKRGSVALHGTRSRYNYGCRCADCKIANITAWRKWYYQSDTKYAHK